MLSSTQISRMFAEQGVKLRIRKEPRTVTMYAIQSPSERKWPLTQL